MKKVAIWALMAALLVLGACRSNPHPMDMTLALQSAKTSADHNALATHYEEAAKEAKTKVEEHIKLLEQYKAKSYLYGKQAAAFEAHCEALKRVYDQAAKANVEMAQMHQKMATTMSASQ